MIDIAQKTGNEVRNEVVVSDFIPFACHYTPSTILTKNGELLKVIKITGSKESENKDLRLIIRRTILKHIPDDNYSIYFHTVRRKKDLGFSAEYPELFSAYVNKRWREAHSWDKKYTNELYVTILYEGQNLNIKSIKDYLRSLTYYTEKKFRNKYLDDSVKNLSDTVKKILDDLKPHGARLLGMSDKNGVLYSEPQQFFSKIVNLSDVKFQVEKTDLSKQLPTHRISFGFNALEVRGETGRHFASIFSIKEYIDLSPKAFDKFIQLPMEFIITESVNFINKNEALKRFKYQHYIFSLSKDYDFERLTGIEEIIKSEKGKATDFGEHQITIMILEDNLKLLEEEVEKFIEAINSLGIMVVREDVMMEDCYWSQLPGNFFFSRRRSLMPSSKMAGLASLYNSPSGNAYGVGWGEAITVFKNEVGSPYFFNFHDESGAGHTLVVGSENSGKRTLVNFILSESRKFGTKIFIIDDSRKSEAFVRASGGNFYDVTRLNINPLLLKEAEDSKKFLRAWFEYLITSEEDKMVTEVERAKINQVVHSILMLPLSERTIEKIIPLFNTEDGKRIKEKLSIWHSGGKYSNLFNGIEDKLDLSKSVNGFNVSGLLEDKNLLGPVLSYIIFRIRTAISGNSPSVIVINNAFGLLDNYVFAIHVERWLDYYKQKNCVIVFVNDVIHNSEKSRISSEIIKKFTTKIFFPISKTSETMGSYYGLSLENIEKLMKLNKSKRLFMIKQAGQDAIINMNTENFSDIMPILSLKKENEVVLDNVMNKFGSEPEKWFPEFKKEIKI